MWLEKTNLQPHTTPSSRSRTHVPLCWSLDPLWEHKLHHLSSSVQKCNKCLLLCLLYQDCLIKKQTILMMILSKPSPFHRLLVSIFCHFSLLSFLLFLEHHTTLPTVPVVWIWPHFWIIFLSCNGCATAGGTVRFVEMDLCCLWLVEELFLLHLLD